MNVTALLAHPDDEIFCAGTLARFVAEGHQVTLWTLFVDVERRVAWEAAGLALGLKHVGGIRFDGMEIEDDFAPSRYFVKHLEPHLPETDLLITHRVNDPNTSHRTIGLIARTFARKNRMSLWGIDSAFAFDTDAPANNHYVNISPYYSTKLDVMRAYDGVLSGQEMDAIEHRDRWNGRLIGHTAAEAFRIVKSVWL